MKYLILPVVSLLAACATGNPGENVTGPREQTAPEAQLVSLFPSDSQILSDEEVAAVLLAKPQLPRTIRVAAVNLGHASAARYWGWSSAVEPDTRRQLSSSLLSVLSSSDRVSKASFLPSFLLPESPSVGHLREAAARYQADAVLVFRTECEIYERFRFFRSPSAKASCRAESAILDVRTGIVPFADESLEDFEIAETSSDASFLETIKRAEANALDSVLQTTGLKSVEWLSRALP